LFENQNQKITGDIARLAKLNIFAKHGSIFANFVFRENPETNFIKNPKVRSLVRSQQGINRFIYLISGRSGSKKAQMRFELLISCSLDP
jgi:hypothetical protein